MKKVTFCKIVYQGDYYVELSPRSVCRELYLPLVIKGIRIRILGVYTTLSFVVTCKLIVFQWYISGCVL